MFTIHDNQLHAFDRPFAQQKRGKILSDLIEAGIGRVYEADRDIVVEDSIGNKTTIRFNEQYVPEKIIKPSGTAYGFTYDEEGRLIQFLLPGNESIEWKYENDLLTGIGLNQTKLVLEQNSVMYPDGSKIHCQYNEAGQLVEMTTRGGGCRKFDLLYKEDRIVYKNTDELGRVTLLESNEVGKIVKVIFPDGKTIEADFDEESQTEYIYFRNGAHSTICYNWGNYRGTFE